MTFYRMTVTVDVKNPVHLFKKILDYGCIRELDFEILTGEPDD